MAIREIRTFDDPVLRKKCRKVETADDHVRQILSDMVDTMYQTPKDVYKRQSEEVCALKPGGEPNNIGRIHMARLLVQKGYFPDVRDVFDTCLGTGCPAYYERQRYSPAECLKLIHHAGGISFLAHPYLIAKSYRSLYPIVQSLKQDGLDGIECIYSSHSPAYEDMCRELCRTQSLIVSAGSDFHGANKPHVQLGRVYGNQTIPESILQKIKEFYRNRL